MKKSKRIRSSTYYQFFNKNQDTQRNNTQKFDQSGIKAYKLLSIQEGISTNKAKNLIDSGVVQVNGVRLEIARTLLGRGTKFKIIEPKQYIIFEDFNIIVIDKPYGIESYELQNQYAPYKLINRLDRDTSGVILLAKNEETRLKAIDEFKAQRVDKIYYALVDGKISEEREITSNISVESRQTSKRAILSEFGIKACTIIKPLAIIGNKSLLEICIPTGKTHQIRIHLASIKFPIIGDVRYNKTHSRKAKRLMLHCHKTSIFGNEFVSRLDVYDEFGIRG
ncbi:RNA pseudouridine synthase [Helicobacter muridarum]|nr:pseudouridine synthase [Helicobacter muridarum]TLD99280.1 RNA pseudouridine synthase [Helicobacter muridarum]